MGKCGEYQKFFVTLQRFLKDNTYIMQTFVGNIEGRLDDKGRIFVLQDEIAQRIENGLALIDLHGPEQMGAVTDHGIRTLVNGTVRKFLNELRNVLLGLAIQLMRVHRNQCVKHPRACPLARTVFGNTSEM